MSLTRHGRSRRHFSSWRPGNRLRPPCRPPAEHPPAAQRCPLTYAPPYEAHEPGARAETSMPSSEGPGLTVRGWPWLEPRPKCSHEHEGLLRAGPSLRPGDDLEVSHKTPTVNPQSSHQRPPAPRHPRRESAPMRRLLLPSAARSRDRPISDRRSRSAERPHRP